MLPPVSTTPTRAAGEALGVRRQGGDAGGAGALDDELLDLEQQVDGVLDAAAPTRRARRRRGLDDRLGDRARARPRRCPRRSSARRVVPPGTIDGHDSRLRRRRPRRRGAGGGDDGDARDQPAAADGHDDAVEVGVVGEQLEADGALAGDDERVVEGVHERAAVGDQLRAPDHRLGQVGARGARRWRRGGGCGPTFTNGVVRGHHDRGGDAEQRGVAGDGLGVVAGRHGHDAGGPLARR